MSRKTKRKHVFKEILDDDFSLPSSHQTIVRIIASKGNNLHEVQAPDKSSYLVSMPTKYRKNVWIRRGNYVLVEPIEEGDKVKAEIVRILTNQHVKYFKEDKAWPEEFDNDNKGEGDNEEGLVENTNRRRFNDSDDEA